MTNVFAQFTRLCITIILLSLVITPQSRAKLDPKSTVGMWLLDEGTGNKVEDLSGNGNDGQVTGAKWINGQFDKALEFDGQAALVDCGTDDSLNIKQGSFGLWLRFAEKPSDAGHLMNPLAKADQYWIHASDDDSIQAKINVAGTRYIATTGADFIKTDVWHHVLGVYDGAALKLYVDGEEKEETETAKGDLNVIADKILAVGTWSDRIDYFQGAIDEVVVTTEAVTAAETRSIFRSGLLAVSPAGKLTATWGTIKTR